MNDLDLEVLGELERRVLWLSTEIVAAANHDRAGGEGVNWALMQRVKAI